MSYAHQWFLENRTRSIAIPESPTFEECDALGYNPSMGKQCPHPIKTLFRDPRLMAPPLKSRASILRELSEHVFIPWIYHELLAGFESMERHDGNTPDMARGQSQKTDKSSFPKFSLLPNELRLTIWEMAIPRRLIAFDSVEREGFRPQLAMPHIAHACHEARQLVLKHGKMLEVPMITDLSTRVNLGFASSHNLMNDSLWEEKEPQWEAAVSSNGMRWNTLVIHDYKDLRSSIHDRCPFLGDCGPSDTVYVVSRNIQTMVEYKITNLEQEPGPVRDAISRIHQDSRYKRHEGQDMLRVVIDLDDHQSLADLVAFGWNTLDEEFLDEEAAALPRYRYNYDDIGRCLNCEREQWDLFRRSWAEMMWLLEQAEDLTDEEKEAIFLWDEPDAEYNSEHPWVREKLASAPRFRPAITWSITIPHGDFEQQFTCRTRQYR